MKWAHHPNLRKRPRTPAKGRGSVQRAIRRAFAASGTEALTSSAIYDWAHIRRRLGRRKSMPFGIYSRTLRTLRAMCDPIERVPPHGAWLWRLRNTADNRPFSSSLLMYVKIAVFPHVLLAPTSGARRQSSMSRPRNEALSHAHES